MGRPAYRVLCALFAFALSIGVFAPSLQAAETTQYTYDALGRVVSAIDQSGKKVAYTYDSAGNRTRVSNGAEFAEIIPTAWSASSTAGTTGLATTNGMRDGVFSTLSSIHVTNVETGAWVMADLGSVQNVNHIAVAAAIESTTGATLADLNDTAVEYSVNGTIWNSAAAIEGVAPGATKTISLGGVSLRYLRIRRLASGRVALGDLQLYSAAAANTPLIANPDSVTTSGAAVTFDPRTNDQDLDGFAIAISGVNPPSHGTAVVNAGVSITYTPNPGYVGADSFLYAVTDGHNGSASAVVSVMVQSSTNHPPVAVNDLFNISDRATAVVDGINNLRPLNNDYDPDGDVLTITGTSTPSHGTVSVIGSSIAQYQPIVGYSGSDSFTYTISDGRGGTATATVAVLSSNTNPVAAPDSITTAQGQAVTFDPRLNDSDPNGDPISIASITPATNGSATLNPNQTVTYAPNPGFYGGDSLTYALSDGRGGTATGIISITVTPSPPPTAVGDSITAAPATPLTFDPRSNDTDPQNRPLTVISLTAPSHGSAVIVSAGAGVTYTAAAGYSGADSFSYTIANDQGATATALVTVNGISVDYLVVGGGGAGANYSGGGGGGGGVLQGSAPLAVGSVTITVGSGGAAGVPGGNGMSSSVGSAIVAVGGGGGGYSTGASGPQSGGSGGGAGAFGAAGANGTSGQGYKGGDDISGGPAGGGGAGGTGGPGVGQVIEGEAGQAGVGGTGTSSAISGSSINYGGGGGGGGSRDSTGVVTIFPGAAGGLSGGGGGPYGTGSAAPANAGGGGGGGGSNPKTHVSGLGGAGGSGIVILRYRGAPKATGGTITQVGGYTIHTFTTSDTFAVTTTNAAPSAVNDSITTPSGLPYTFDPRLNDSDPNGDAIAVLSASTPTHGVVTVNTAGLPLTYTPTLGYTGSDSFIYTIGDGQGLTSTATVSVTVTGGRAIDYLVVGGGGGGGSREGGGGGGGGIRTGSFLVASGAYPVTVGAGGFGGSSASASAGANGATSALGSLVTASGGGGGAGSSGPAPSTTANGGGGDFQGYTAGAASTGGGYSGGNSSPLGGGGGGGATASGLPGPVLASGPAGNGGSGSTSSISGTATSYGGGGGGGGGYPAGTAGDSSAAAGAIGALSDDGAAASANHGGGGGGGGDDNDPNWGDVIGNGGTGGSGIVIIRYLTGTMTATGGTITTSGGYTIHTFTGSGTFTVP